VSEVEGMETLRALCEKPAAMTEGGTRYIYLPQLKFVAAGIQRESDALLCPGPHNGYTTRLFLSAPIPERGANWSQWQIFGRTWHTWSWQNVPANLPMIQMLLEHLRALR
jgi:hypothetical protein